MAEIQNFKASTNGRWTKEQHQKFLLGLQLFGKNWKKIQGLIGTRTGSQIRSHAQKFFLKIQKEGESDSINQKDSVEEPSVLSHACSQNDKSTEMSYFFEQILKQSKGQSNFDFWSQLIDHGRDNASITESCFDKRKGSFIGFGEQYNSHAQQSSSGGNPTKIVKV